MLGKAHYRAGQWQDAVAALQKALELRKGGDSPLKAWIRQHPGSDAGKATVREIADAWNSGRATE